MDSLQDAQQREITRLMELARTLQEQIAQLRSTACLSAAGCANAKFEECACALELVHSDTNGPSFTHF